MDCRASLAMTRSNDKSIVLWRCRRWRILVRHDGKGHEESAKAEVPQDWVCQRPTGLGGEDGPTWRGSARFVRWDR